MRPFEAFLPFGWPGKEWRGSEISCGLKAYPRRDRPPPEARGGRLRLGPQSPQFAIATDGDNSNTIPASKTSLTLHLAALLTRVRVATGVSREGRAAPRRTRFGRGRPGSLRKGPPERHYERSARCCRALQAEHDAGRRRRLSLRTSKGALRQREKGAGHDRVRLVILSGSRERSDPKSGRVEGLKAVRGAGIAPPFCFENAVLFQRPASLASRGRTKLTT